MQLIKHIFIINITFIIIKQYEGATEMNETQKWATAREDTTLHNHRCENLRSYLIYEVRVLSHYQNLTWWLPWSASEKALNIDNVLIIRNSGKKPPTLLSL
jgi:hypothetical protein